MPMTMGGRIRELRQRRGMTQEQLGEILYMKKSTISAYFPATSLVAKGTILPVATRGTATFSDFKFRN